MSTIDQQLIDLSSILAIVTNPDMVAKNIVKLRDDMVKADKMLTTVQGTKEEAEKRHALALQVEQGAADRHANLDARENELKKKEQHWLDKDTQQKEAEKAFNEIKLQHAARVRDAEQKETANAKRAASLDEREAFISKRDAESAKLHETAAQLKAAYEAKVESIRDFASQVG
ncbi:MAG: hypothetical protein WCD70_15140 [Alphaproteobacteria bacterium]